MIIAIHIIIALSSVLLATFAAWRPSQAIVKANYTLLGLTLASGTYVTVATHAHLLQACASGLFYVSAVAAGLVIAQHKLAAEKLVSRDRFRRH